MGGGGSGWILVYHKSVRQSEILLLSSLQLIFKEFQNELQLFIYVSSYISNRLKVNCRQFQFWNITVVPNMGAGPHWRTHFFKLCHSGGKKRLICAFISLVLMRIESDFPVYSNSPNYKRYLFCDYFEAYAPTQMFGATWMKVTLIQNVSLTFFRN